MKKGIKKFKESKESIKESIINEENSNRKYDKWRRSLSGKVIAYKKVLVADPYGNERNYFINIKYKETSTRDILYFDELLLGKNGMAHAASNMQNKSRKLFDIHNEIIISDENELNNIIDNPNELVELVDEWLGQPIDEKIQAWFKTGVMTVKEIFEFKYKY